MLTRVSFLELVKTVERMDSVPSYSKPIVMLELLAITLMVNTLEIDMLN